MSPAPKHPALHRAAPLAQPLDVPPGHFEYRWRWLDRPTPPVTAGGLAFYGLSTGLLRAVRLRDGTEAWSYRTGGAIMTAPVLSAGRLYAGSGDGWVYCLDAASGEPAWRWRGAPAERDMMVYDRLMSSWPVIALVSDGETLYGSAGLYAGNGAVLFALDAATGEPRWTRWQRDQEALLRRVAVLERNGRAGYPALISGTVRASEFAAVGRLYDTATGLPPRADAGPVGLLALPDALSQDCLVLSDRMILRGGNPLFENPDVRWNKYSGNYRLYGAAGSKWPTSARRPFKLGISIPRSIIAPALDEREIAMVGGAFSNTVKHTTCLSLWKTEDWLEHKPGHHKRDPLEMKRARWFHPDLQVNALALCPEAVIAVIGELEPSERKFERPVFCAWRLCAYARADGKELWSVDLPCEPIYNGIAPAADGSWIIILRDGNAVTVAEQQ